MTYPERLQISVVPRRPFTVNESREGLKGRLQQGLGCSLQTLEQNDLQAIRGGTDNISSNDTMNDGIAIDHAPA